MIHKHTVKFRTADDYAAFWRVPVPLVKSVCICPAMRLHPFLETHGDAFAKRRRRIGVLSFFSGRLVFLAYDRRWQAVTDVFDASVNDYWQRQQAYDFHLELMDGAAF